MKNDDRGNVFSEFTYNWYNLLLSLLKNEGYITCGYDDWAEHEKCVILRHDVDQSLHAAECMAKLEYDAGVKSTYFVLVSSDFYNVFSSENRNLIQKIISYGHSIGLHFDETVYPQNDKKQDEMPALIKKEAEILEQVIQSPVTSVSMHRPSRDTLEADIVIPNMVNSYSHTFFMILNIYLILGGTGVSR